jgi:hypothetical protein
MRFVKIDLSASGDGVIATGIAGKKFRVITYVICSTVNCLVTFKSGTTALTGPMAIGAYSNIFNGNTDLIPAGLIGVLETAVGEDLVLNLSTNSVVGGHILYQEVMV